MSNSALILTSTTVDLENINLSSCTGDIVVRNSNSEIIDKQTIRPTHGFFPICLKDRYFLSVWNSQYIDFSHYFLYQLTNDKLIKITTVKNSGYYFSEKRGLLIQRCSPIQLYHPKTQYQFSADIISSAGNYTHAFYSNHRHHKLYRSDINQLEEIKGAFDDGNQCIIRKPKPNSQNLYHGVEIF